MYHLIFIFIAFWIYIVVSRKKSLTGAPIITTDQMADWHAMMVSLTWNVQAWRGWIQENIDRALDYENKGIQLYYLTTKYILIVSPQENNLHILM